MNENNITGKKDYSNEPIITKPDNLMVWSILETVLLCMPLGVAAILYSNKVDLLWAEGDRMGSLNAAKTAKKLLIIGACLAVAFWILYILFFVVYMVIIIGVVASEELVW